MQIQIQIQILINDELGKARKRAPSQKIPMVVKTLDDIDEPLNGPIEDETCDVLG